MKVRPSSLPEVLIIEPASYADDRGAFLETWRDERYQPTLGGTSFRQDSVSVSRRGVVRGLHFQHPHAQGKLVGVLSGAAFDVAVDVRTGSPDFGRWVGVELSARGHQLWIPAGFAHGFQALTDDVVFYYKSTDIHHPECERSVHYADPDLAIQWPLPEPVVSPRDAAAPRLNQLEPGALPAWR